jgi:hypothetical protein
MQTIENMFFDDPVIIENVIDIELQEKIKNLLLGDNFPWYFCNDITDSKNVNNQKRFGFKHNYIENKKINSNYYYNLLNLILQSCKKIKFPIKEIINGRSFLQLPNPNSSADIDTPHIDTEKNHIVFLYYVKSSDGDTVLFDLTKEDIEKNENLNLNKIKSFKIKPEQGKLVMFNGKYYHSAYQPKLETRCVINFNLL